MNNITNVTPSSEERNMAVISHVAMPIGTIFSAGTIGWLVPLVLYILNRKRSQFIRQASANALNFAIMMFIWSVAAWLLILVGIPLSVFVFPIIFVIIGAIIAFAALVMSIVFPIIACAAANRGEVYCYPLTPSFVS
ncbi:DUF4870 domain-containing protein [Canibacter zhoujuaniae]|uniref:DUF4870 domain-containing protein n=1 Tax=Canibacter zhoujuaniae TaxID=2708343 RepID=UPI0014241716|nr:DUF4870 domain-containing protein [Canibacter zhoujuaniae]